MSLQRLYRTSRPARWALDALVVSGMVGALAVLHALPSVSLFTNSTWQNF